MNRGTVLHLTCMISTKYGALERFLLEIAKRTRDAGYRSVFQYEEQPESRAYLEALEAAGVEILIEQVQGSPGRPLSFPDSIRSAFSLVRRIRPDILHVHFPDGYLLPALPWVAKVAAVQRVFHSVHCDPHQMGRLQKLLSFRAYDLLLPVSEAVTRTLLHGWIPQKRLSTLYLGLFGAREIQPEERRRIRAEFGIPQDATLLANISFDAEFKALDLLVQAVQKVSSVHPDLHLLQIGVTPEQSQLPELGRQLGIGNRVHWAGIRDEGWRYLAAADVYIQSSRFAEGLPLSILEAMAMGLPVLATRVAGIPEMVVDGETGLLAEPGDLTGLVEMIESSLAQSDLWGGWGIAGRARYHRLFNGEESVRKMVDEHYGLETDLPTQIAGTPGLGA